mmetsp:Transcript_10687/g.22625  ORF Transcript_10687/g.22625 Transcript_10687/m.22625 type:complete len:703 (-) Transcript_10687:55-2163(-)
MADPKANAEHLHRQQKFHKFMTSLQSKSPKKVIASIRSGDDMTTQAIVLMPPEWSGYRRKLVRAGLIEAVLHFLSMSANRTFDEALATAKGDVAFCSVWTNILMNITARRQLPDRELDAARVKIAESIAPMVECMTDMEGRLFFKDREDWCRNALFFAGLVENLVLTPSTIPLLVDYGEDSVRKFMVQALFFDVYREDIKKELSDLEAQRMVMQGCILTLQNSAAAALQEFVDVPRDPFDEESEYTLFTPESKETLNYLGNLPAVYPGYESAISDEITLATGILKVAPTMGRSFDSLFWIFGQLCDAMPRGCFGEGTVQKLVELCRDRAWNGSTFQAKDAFIVLEALSVYIVRRVESGPSIAMPNDNAMASAIGAGMIELIVEMVSTAKQNIQNDPSYQNLVNTINNTLRAAGAIALSRKTNKKIRERAPSIRSALAKVPKGASSGCIEMIYALLDKAASGHRDTDSNVCRYCLKTVYGDAIKTCSKCLRSTYCSRECQVLHWGKQHKKECKMMKTNKSRALEQGLSEKEAHAAAKAEENLSVSGNMLFAKEEANILLQASLRGYSIVDCVVMMDFRETPPTIETMMYDAYLEEGQLEFHHPKQYAHTSGIIDRNRKNGALTVACMTLAPDGTSEALLKTFRPSPLPPLMLQLLPDDIGCSSPWISRQRIAEHNCPHLDEMSREERERRIEILMNTGRSSSL